MTNMQILILLSIICCLCHSKQNISSKDQQTIPMKCIPIEDHQQTHHHFICAEQNYRWIFKQMQTDYNGLTDQTTIDIDEDAGEHFMAKLKESVGSLWLIEAQLKQSSFIFHYIGLQQNATTGQFYFPHIQVPDSIRQIQNRLQRGAKDDILDQVPQKTHTLRNVIILIIILAGVVLGINYWKGKQIKSRIDQKPNDLRQVMLAQMDIKEEQNRKNSSGLAIRSQPPKKLNNF